MLGSSTQYTKRSARPLTSCKDVVREELDTESSETQFRTALAMRSPESADDDFVIAERVIQVEGNPPQVDTTDVGNRGSGVERADTRKDAMIWSRFASHHAFSRVQILSPRPKFR